MRTTPFTAGLTSLFANRVPALIALAGWFLSGAHVVGAEPAPDFAREVRPILEQNCFKCHGPTKQKGGVRLDNRHDAFIPGDSGESPIVAHAPDKSLIISLLTSDDDTERMPQKAGPLQPEQIAVLKRWVLAGAPWPGENSGDGLSVAAAPTGKREMVVTAEDRTHWSYLPLRRPSLPAVKNAGWVRTPIDRFVLARLEVAGLTPAPEASTATLRRRLSFDLTGLPPAPDERARTSAELLASTAYGQHWARLWLDAARYADSAGYEVDADRALAWRYRDFVINAFNHDLPFDQFVRWQLAGDELAPDHPEAVIATGFLGLGPFLPTQPTEPLPPREKTRYDNLDDIVATTSSAFLGLTVACARCHDHKFDAIPTRDYYSLAAAFAGGERADYLLQAAARERELFLDRARRAWLEAEMGRLNVPEEERILFRYPYEKNNKTERAVWAKWREVLFPPQAVIRASLSASDAAELAALDAQVAADAPGERAFAWADLDGTPVKNWMLSRGDPMHKVEEQPFSLLQVITGERTAKDYLAQVRPQIRAVHTTGQRAALAVWMTDVDYGAGALLARVIVNRLWLGHFGQGLVRTPNDFGVQGDAPANPELLEWLAAELVDSGWSLKHIQQLIVDSATWRQGISTEGGERAFVRRHSQRLDADELRDSLLFVSGKLQPDQGGPAFRPVIPAEAMSTRTVDKYPDNLIDGPPVWRRSIYHFIKRSVRYPFAEVFDAPDTTSSSGQRGNTIVPTQQLTLLNDPFVRARAQDLAQRLTALGQDPARRVEAGFRFALARAPTPAEAASSADFIAQHSLTDWCHALFTLNEFIYVD